ncbi:hypothetical protein [Arenimonas terrae]|uniref:Lipoprotein n=1 Tax=Arenimonas terrae TaxID=2546226 RepID=A0A5C4RPR9_9GAMM|nr:hypothetical protein [Arenimonas terrae]TNJ32721.1 hypothetical protein E1B00_15105 [Arenimonas terrae]
MKSIPAGIMVLLLAACHASSARKAANEMTICQINAAGDAVVGALVRSSGIYKTDGANLSFFVDEACGAEANGIDLGRAWGVPSYDALREKWTRDCEAAGRRIVCVVERKVFFTGRVRRSEDGGHPVIDLKSIHESR